MNPDVPVPRSPRPLRAVVACDWFVKYAAAQSAALSGAGAEVVLLCRDHAHEFGEDTHELAATLAAAHAAGVRVLQLPGRLSQPRALRALPGLARALRRFSPDIVHVHEGVDPRVGLVAPRAPRVLTVHDPVPHPGQPVPPARTRWLLWGSRARWRRRADALVIHSPALASGLPTRPDQRVAVIPHGLAPRPVPLPPPSRTAVAFFGRLTAYKGLDVLARAMPLVWAQRPDTVLHVAGTGPSELPLRDERVHRHPGYLPEAAVDEFLADASLAVLPYTEASGSGAGSVAVGLGVPVVVTRVGGLPDLALDPSYVAEPGDAPSLAAAILAHLDDGADVRARLLAEIAGPRSWAAVAQATLSLYRELCR